MSKRTKQETIEYFRKLALTYAVEAHRTNSEFFRGKAEAYELAAFEVKHNMKDYEEDDII